MGIGMPLFKVKYSMVILLVCFYSSKLHFVVASTRRDSGVTL